MNSNTLNHKIHLPPPSQSEFIERFWTVTNPSTENHTVVVVPDGRIDLIFALSPNEPFTSNIIGIENEPSLHTVPPGTVIMGVGLKLLAVEYCLQYSVASLLGKAAPLTSPNPNITETDLKSFPVFCDKITSAFQPLIPPTIDKRKQTLFDTLYKTQGSLKIQEYSDQCFWTSRQINRYFTEWFGLSLKEYCSILRFRASIDQIKKGKFFPEQNYSDQPHFIREVKKFTGVTPKELFKRQNDRFIQFYPPTH
ncbi:MAG: helix-turn-helix transcriptional regulator [Bacteroidetes bacterium]|nr:helix-turn-helix transcriptional regulator [Bacteroidota bacterium]